MLKRYRSWLALALFVSLLEGLGWAQSYNATISGTVSDPSGAAVPNAQLTLTSLDTGTVTKTTSGSDGLYSFPNLRPGRYELRAVAQGFKEYVQTGILLTMNLVVRQDVSLQLGAAVQAVEVSGTLTPLNTTDAEQKGSITPEILKDLPIEVAGTVRSAANFAILVPGVTTGSGGNPFDARINGGLQSGDEAILDGVSLQEGLMSQSGMVSIQTDFPTSPDMVSELSVLTSNYEPQYGSSTSGQIILETKSGTNQYHGSLYEYHRNTVLNARQFGVANRSSDIENEFGGAFGGPLWIPHLWEKSRKTFFYLNLSGYRAGGGVTAPILSVPTMQERQGNFSDWVDSSGNLIPVYDPDTLRPNPNYNPNLTTGPNNLPFLRDQFMGCNGNQPNVICSTDPRLQDSVAGAWFKFLPAPNLPGLFNNYVAKARPENLLFHTNYFNLRVDQYFREKDHFSASVYYQGAAPNYLSEVPTAISYDNHASPEYAFIDRFNWDHTLSPSLLNHFALGYHNRMEGYGSNDVKYASAFPQIPGVPTHAYPPQINISSFTQMGEQSGIDSQDITARPDFTLNDLFTWVKDKHTIKIGGEYRWLAENNRTAGGGSGTFSFGYGETGLQGIISGSPVASFLLGEVDSASATFRAIGANYPRAAAYVLHVGDTWKMTPKLSVNYGLRWDTFTPSVEKWNRTSFFDPLGPNPGAGGRPGRLAFAGTTWGAASFGRRAPEYTWNNGFAPRFGIAYSVSPKTVVRTGYGIFFTQAFYPGWGGGIAQDGFSTTPTFSSSNSGLSPAFLLRQSLISQNIGFPQNFARPPFIDSSFLNGQNAPNYRPFDANRRAYAQQWNLTIEHELTGASYFSVAYVGNKGTRLPARVSPINTLNPSLLSTGQKLYDQFGPNDTMVDGVPAPYPGWASQMQACSPTVAQALVPYPQYCGVMYGLNENDGNSTYHAFQAKYEKRYSNGLWILTSYTLSKTIDDADNTQADALTWSGAHGVISPYERQRNKALAVDDVPQLLSVAMVYELPVGRGKRFGSGMPRVLNGVVEGWSLSSVFRISAGVPFFFRSGYCNVPGQFAAGCIPGVKPEASPWLQSEGSFDPGRLDSSGNPMPLFNVNSFEDFNSFNFYTGQGPRISNYRQPGYHNQDIGIIKNIRIKENVSFQFRGEFFNAWNWHIFTCPTQCWGGSAFDTNPGDTNFGLWNGTVTSPRNIQVVGRLTF
ncbi:MAG TPA: carboxypeptidase regulatory-like domain-containing protein [Terriglobia bacterium]|nr:carboxypeptidase regulatory-like domain-containing protein [Terriglobia bacterium]